MVNKKQGCWQIINTATEIDDETGEHLYWSNKRGWVDRVSAEKYTTARKNKSHAPLDGKFVACRRR